MRPVGATKSWIAGTALAVALGARLAAQPIAADRLLLPPTTVAGDGMVYLGKEPFLHAWDDLVPLGYQGTNTFLGGSAGRSWDLPGNRGHGNTGIGSWALTNITFGENNTAVGAAALYSLEFGHYNTAVGAGALSDNKNGFFNTAVGEASLVRNQSGFYNSGFGHAALHDNVSGSRNTAVGNYGLLRNISGGGNTALGFRALEGNVVGEWNTALGFEADVASADLVNATAIGAHATATASNMVRIGNEAVTVIEGQVPFSWVSDRRWKKDIETLDLGLDLVRRLHPVSYRLKDGNGLLDMGFVAQEVAAVLGPGYNAVAAGADQEHLLSMRYTDLIAPLVRAVQELDEQRAAVEAALALLRADNAAMQAEIVDLRERLAIGRQEVRAGLEPARHATLTEATGTAGETAVAKP